MYSIELKFGVYNKGHCHIYCIDFGEFKVNSFFYNTKKKYFYALQPMQLNYKKYASV